ncbi:hypothetical protein H5410_052509 [Solanum commersonii]|uniref:Uncharacterized protein n=1 Tax=Solanum commersonii TaxID=4109 RepID=A0A9J5X1N8_SOLCO|nr:hypothetical protein H5410_052509 [Solanum commersonii]
MVTANRFGPKLGLLFPINAVTFLYVICTKNSFTDECSWSSRPSSTYAPMTSLSEIRKAEDPEFGDFLHQNILLNEGILANGAQDHHENLIFPREYSFSSSIQGSLFWGAYMILRVEGEMKKNYQLDPLARPPLVSLLVVLSGFNNTAILVNFTSPLDQSFSSSSIYFLVRDQRWLTWDPAKDLPFR